MSNKPYSGEFRIEALKQVTERGYRTRKVASRLGISSRRFRAEVLRSTSGYRIRKGNYGRQSIVAPNQLQQNFEVEKLNQAGFRTLHIFGPMRVCCTWLS